MGAEFVNDGGGVFGESFSGVVGLGAEACDVIVSVANFHSCDGDMALMGFARFAGCWGSNEPYSRVIGAKHPKILGMPYDEAWPEVSIATLHRFSFPPQSLIARLAFIGLATTPTRSSLRAERRSRPRR